MTQNTESSLPSISLYLKDASSDKEYHARVVAEGEGFLVRTSWGRRGGTLQHGSKPAKPVAREAAIKEYQKIVTSKTAGGYTEGKGGQRFSGTDAEGRVSAYLPQLLNAIDEAALPALIKGAWWAQEKVDGHRRLVEKVGDQVQGINRKGLYVPLPEGLASLLREAPGDFVLDGELVGQRFHVFDILTYGGDVRRDSLAQRQGYLDQIFSVWDANPDLVRVATAKTSEQKQALYERLRGEEREGIVFKDPTSPYTPGRPNSGGSALKLKFVATASVLVVAQNGGKRSVLVGVRDAAGTLIEVGNVTIPANQDMPKPDTVVEVEYLYAYPSGSLFQPVYRGERDDIPPQECTLDQLKLKPQDMEG